MVVAAMNLSGGFEASTLIRLAVQTALAEHPNWLVSECPQRKKDFWVACDECERWWAVRERIHTACDASKCPFRCPACGPGGEEAVQYERKTAKDVMAEAEAIAKRDLCGGEGEGMRASLPLALLNDVFRTGKGSRSGWKGIVKDAVENEWPMVSRRAAAQAPDQDPVVFNHMVQSLHATVGRSEWVLDETCVSHVLLLDDLENKLVRWARSQTKRLRLRDSILAKTIVEDDESTRALEELRESYAKKYEPRDRATVRGELGGWVVAANTA